MNSFPKNPFVGLPPPVCADCGRAIPGDRCEPCHQARTTPRGIPDMWAWANFDSPELCRRVRSTGHPIAALQRPLESIFITLTGSSGSGKTSLAVAALRRLASEAGGGRFVATVDLVRARLENSSALMSKCRGAPVLLLDDLGQEDQRWAAEPAELIWSRFAAKRRTLVTTGLGRDEVASRYGDGIARRMFDESLVVRLGGSGLKAAGGVK